MKLFSSEDTTWLEKEYIFMDYEKAICSYLLELPNFFFSTPPPFFLADVLNWFL